MRDLVEGERMRSSFPLSLSSLSSSICVRFLCVFCFFVFCAVVFPVFVLWSVVYLCHLLFLFFSVF